ncbi:aminopeptidase N-like isoform X1 [Synchiropus splendidus]|uniref:aminopeptidase N-like isoform X1 n=1 Tax=Synchiropus splendidus TaxID=270530 RepID=UPI00237EAFC3|nr:aminopeptidase N-like isoform X1 [Synchiropus splendidus]
MGRVYRVGRNVALGLVVAAVCALLTIMALSVALNTERVRSRGRHGAGATPPTPVSTPAAAKQAWERYRLPASLRPLAYEVLLWPRLTPDHEGLYVFSGRSTVVFECRAETDLIIIHASKLNFTQQDGLHAELRGHGGSRAPAVRSSWLVAETEFLVLQLSGSLTEGAQYRLSTEFVGELADDLKGFYRGQYVEDGEKKLLAVSQMQPTYARKAFPCFDEPAMKARFNITLVHPPGTVALSNSREASVEETRMGDVSVTVTRFEPTVLMSTYLLGFLVCNFETIHSPDPGCPTIRIWARKKAILDRQGDYAANVTCRILTFFEQYYDFPYPLDKSDQVALPDFNAGAMENWGLITYRETALLYDRDSSSTGNKQRVATVIAHELAHMWFGNLVTMRWWNDLWLNEGFASYVEYLGADFAEPTWSLKDQIVLYDVQRVFQVDALASSHPLSRPEEEVNSPTEINEMFSTISYYKGASVLRMVSGFLGEKVFARGVASYLKSFQYGNTVYSDLWTHLQQEVDSTPGSKIPRAVHDIMNRWTLQMGFPVVTVDTRTGSVSQKHFLLDPESVVTRPSLFNYVWLVPVKWIKSGVDQEQYWLLQERGSNRKMRVSGDDWVLANTNVSGYFRVNYDLDNWERLLALLNRDHQALPVVNRAQLIDDAFNLARAKMVSSTLALRTTTYLSQERDFIPWEAALANLEHYILMLDRSEAYGALQAYLRKQIQPLFQHFRGLTANWTRVPAGHNDQYNQVNAIATACRMGLSACRELTRGWFRKWMENPRENPIHPNLKSTVYCNGVAFGGAEEWDFTWRMFQNATLASEATRLRGALACTKLPWLLNRYLSYTLDPTKIRKQDATSTIGYISRNVIGTPLAWNFVREKWKLIFQQHGDYSFSFPNMIKALSRRFSTEFELQELQRFQEDHAQVGFGSATQALRQAMETTAANIKWVSENKAPVLAWLSQQAASAEG